MNVEDLYNKYTEENPYPLGVHQAEPTDSNALPPQHDVPTLYDERAYLDDLRTSVNEEHQYRQDEGVKGSLDLPLSAMASGASLTILETVQTERHSLLARGIDLGGAPLAELSKMPLDYKAIAVAAGAYALTSAASKIMQRDNFPTVRDRAMRQAASAETFVPYDSRERASHRLRRRLGQAAATAVSVTVAYQAAKHGNVSQDAVAAGALHATAAAVTVGNKFRLKRNSRKAAQAASNTQRQAYDQLTGEWY